MTAGLAGLVLVVVLVRLAHEAGARGEHAARFVAVLAATAQGLVLAGAAGRAAPVLAAAQVAAALGLLATGSASPRSRAR